MSAQTAPTALKSASTERPESASGLHWVPEDRPPAFAGAALARAAADFREAACLVADPRTGERGVGIRGRVETGQAPKGSFPCVGLLPPLFPEFLGCRTFQETHRVRYPYAIGAMARGIASAELVAAGAREGLLAFFGAAGLPVDRVRGELRRIREALPEGTSFGCNLIHSPQEPEIEDHLVEALIEEDIRHVEASAFMGLRPSVVRAAFAGVAVRPDGTLSRPRHVFAKISRGEVARAFMSPPPEAMLRELTASGRLTESEARLAAQLPVAGDVTVESDSGGHTDGRPLVALLPDILRLRDQIAASLPFPSPVRVGAAGGLGTPEAVAAAFAMGADFVLTGSVNQPCRESGLHPRARAMLLSAGIADMARCPSADMFEIGAEVQVLKRGTLFPQRARRLQDLYRRHQSLDDLPPQDRQWLEKDLFRTSIADAWASTAEFWSKRRPGELAKAAQDPRHQMALLFRAYLGLSSRWPLDGTQDRITDYQIWAGPAQGSFNTWVKGTFLEGPEGRTVGEVALNLLEGACHVQRARAFRAAGVAVPGEAASYQPRPLASPKP